MNQTPSLTAVVHAIVKKAPSGMDTATIVELLGKDYNTGMSELSRQPRHKFDADLVLPAMNLADSDAPLHFLARQRGGVFIKLPQALEGGDPVQLACLKSVKEFGELMSVTGAALADGTITAEERDRITREGHEAVTATMALLKLVGEIGRARA